MEVFLGHIEVVGHVLGAKGGLSFRADFCRCGSFSW